MADEQDKPSLFELWFGLTARVDRKRYLLSGLGLMLSKYLVDGLIVYVGAGKVLLPWQYLSPMLAHRQDAMDLAWGGTCRPPWWSGRSPSCGSGCR